MTDLCNRLGVELFDADGPGAACRIGAGAEFVLTDWADAMSGLREFVRYPDHFSAAEVRSGIRQLAWTLSMLGCRGWSNDAGWILNKIDSWEAQRHALMALWNETAR